MIKIRIFGRKKSCSKNQAGLAGGSGRAWRVLALGCGWRCWNGKIFPAWGLTRCSAASDHGNSFFLLHHFGIFWFIWDLPPTSAAFFPRLENIKEKSYLLIFFFWLVRVALCSCRVDPVLPCSQPSLCLSFPTPKLSRLLCRAAAHNGPFIPLLNYALRLITLQAEFVDLQEVSTPPPPPKSPSSLLF